jgi:anti-sigma B factor antagonist
VGKAISEIKDGIGLISWRSSKLIGDRESLQLKDEVNKLIDQGIKQIIIDFTELKWSNSTGLGILLSAWKNTSSSNAELVTIISSERISSILAVTNIKSIIKTFEKIEDALAYFAE